MFSTAGLAELRAPRLRSPEASQYSGTRRQLRARFPASAQPGCRGNRRAPVRSPSGGSLRGEGQPGMELPEPVRQRLGNFSRTVFGDSSRTGPESSEAADNEMVSSLPLQMSLYFNTYFFPLWWVSCIMMLHLKYSVLPDYYKFIVVTVIILIPLIEAVRLYLGYMGNLQEKVPELAGFWLLSLLLQLPLILFLLLNEGLTNLPLEKAIHIIFSIFLTFQVISAFLTLKKMVNQLAARFHLQDFDRLSASRGDMRRMRSCIEEI